MDVYFQLHTYIHTNTLHRRTHAQHQTTSRHNARRDTRQQKTAKRTASDGIETRRSAQRDMTNARTKKKHPRKKTSAATQKGHPRRQAKSIRGAGKKHPREKKKKRQEQHGATIRGPKHRLQSDVDDTVYPNVGDMRHLHDIVHLQLRYYPPPRLRPARVTCVLGCVR